jgi:hypothetical protein
MVIHMDAELKGYVDDITRKLDTRLENLVGSGPESDVKRSYQWPNESTGNVSWNVAIGIQANPGSHTQAVLVYCHDPSAEYCIYREKGFYNDNPLEVKSEDDAIDEFVSKIARR